MAGLAGQNTKLNIKYDIHISECGTVVVSNVMQCKCIVRPKRSQKHVPNDILSFVVQNSKSM